MVELVNFLKFVMCYTLCVIYSSWIGFGLLLGFVFKRSTKFWEVKKRTVKPQILSNNDYGEHKFMTVNVSLSALLTLACSLFAFTFAAGN